ncbi:DAL1A protein, partial [Oreotrochilus melanogaster]|nr:DAL1A protein [Oreotrochilus melanogaster]
VKAGGMRVPKKQENRPVEKNAKPPGKEKSRYSTAGLLHPASKSICILSQLLSSSLMLQMSHRIHAAALQVAHQKPQPALEKYILPK